MALAENMARGLPVIASDLGAFTEVLGNAGLIFRTGDAEDLARALSRLLDDPESARSLGEQARQRVLRSFSFGGMIEAHASLYREVCTEARH